MIFIEPLPFVQSFVGMIDDSIKEHTGRPVGLSRIQRVWLSFCLMGILLTNSVCWARFEKIGLGGYKVASLSWMFRHTKISWKFILQISVRVILKSYGITGGTLVLDDSDKKRSKKTTKISGVHKLKDKASGGFITGQNIVLLLLVTATITIPVGVTFYQPDPVRSKWVKNDKAMKRKGLKER